MTPKKLPKRRTPMKRVALKRAATKRKPAAAKKRTPLRRTAVKRTPKKRKPLTIAQKKARRIKLKNSPRPQTERRKELEARYKAHKATLPQVCQCPFNGRWYEREDMEHHHPAGRRPSTMLFVVPVSPSGHRRIHQNPKRAEELGLLWPGRNTRQFTFEDASKMIAKVPHPKTFIECVILWAKSEHLCQTPQSLQPEPTPQP